mgnify:CR=1 FL=1
MKLARSFRLEPSASCPASHLAVGHRADAAAAHVMRSENHAEHRQVDTRTQGGGRSEQLESALLKGPLDDTLFPIA